MAPGPNSSFGGAGAGSAARDDATVNVPSKDPKKDDKKDENLSEEDLALKQQLELNVERVPDPDPGLHKVALENMSYLADILSVLALTMSAEGESESLKCRLLGSQGDIGSWDHEYVRNLAGEISQEYSKRQARIAQGLVPLGKGLLTLNPYHSERFLLSPMALAGLLTMLHACLDMKAIILGKYHHVLYFLVLTMQRRMLMTVDENLKPLSVPVHVGQSVDVVGRAGRPKTITGFQTHSTPVLLAAGDQAELASEKYIHSSFSYARRFHNTEGESGLQRGLVTYNKYSLNGEASV